MKTIAFYLLFALDLILIMAESEDTTIFFGTKIAMIIVTLVIWWLMAPEDKQNNNKIENGKYREKDS